MSPVYECRIDDSTLLGTSMTITSTTGGARYKAPPRDAFAPSFARILMRFVRAIAREHRIRRDTRDLMTMSDHLLKDIGLTRSQVRYAVRFGRLG
jgi:uncharacterized protein YjiS (DUF1127 family)